jgi:hypothetical protein
LARAPPGRAPGICQHRRPLLSPSTLRRPRPAQHRVDQDVTRRCPARRRAVASPGAGRRGPPPHHRAAASRHCPALTTAATTTYLPPCPSRPVILLERSPRRRSGIRPAPKHHLHWRAPPPGRYFPLEPPQAPYKKHQGLLAVPHPILEPQRSLAPPPPPFAPPPPTSAAGRSLPWNHLHKPSPTKVSTGIGSPRPPLHFPLSSAAADPWGAGNHQRRPDRPHGLPPSPASVLFEGMKMAF